MGWYEPSVFKEQQTSVTKWKAADEMKELMRGQSREVLGETCKKFGYYSQ